MTDTLQILHENALLKEQILSKDEQLQRFKARLDDPARNWKISESDYKEREYWDDYIAADEDMLNKCSTDKAPWYVIPADKKWFTRLAVAAIIIRTLDDLKLAYPTVSEVQQAELAAARQELLAQGIAEAADKAKKRK